MKNNKDREKDRKRFEKFQENYMFGSLKRHPLVMMEDSMEIDDLWKHRFNKRLKCADVHTIDYYESYLSKLKENKVIKVKKRKNDELRVSLTFKGMWYGFIIEEYSLL